MVKSAGGLSKNFKMNLVNHFLIACLLFVLVIVACSPAVRFSNRSNSRQNELAADIRETGQSRLWQAAQSWLNVPYKFGGLDRNGIDCSALSRILYRDAFGLELPRMARDQMQGGRFVRQPWLKEGDLLFFRDDRGDFQDHVGVFLGNGKFIHASSSRGVIISDLFSAYYQERLISARRYLD
jgi:cell wall-associated NlpC family hydrolase